MNIPDYDAPRLDRLIADLLDGTLPDAERGELGEILAASRQARDHYRSSVRIHAALIRHAPPLPVRESKPVSRPLWPVALAAAACVAIAGWIAFPRTGVPVAVLSGTNDAQWGGTEPAGELMGVPLELRRGFAEISFRSGVRVTVEGPCRFRVKDLSSLEFGHGRASVKAPDKKPAGFAFHLDTPGGRLTDLGTEFGVSVGTGSLGAVVMTEVFHGEIEVPSDHGARRRMLAGDAAAILKETDGTRLVTTVGDYPVDLGDVARRLPAPVVRRDFSGNLALGKPVTTPAYLSKAGGSVFPPDNLTDGRLNDTGSPGDWSFWLAPDGETGEATIDLLQPETIGRVVLQNTRNRRNGDRGMKEFVIRVSEDGQVFHEVHRGEMRRVEDEPSPGVDFPFETISFAPVRARYVMIQGISHYRSKDRQPSHRHYGLHSGGLNEVMIFVP
ncbi:discoidin domain-containing protein [Luteolibacter sp. SL250]|uniref:discoidin domain-containing protein n=1 Tax=Luteolibacter sp. SL250 TaxID=2995170 RepID=UPI002272265A|nr:discoidin domain-containing protein [Luteolibacter sp. SL250]WAC19272.1 discoidin domain-containing protein [Luteolibacter sp. SL250]